MSTIAIEPRKTALYEAHVASGARMVDFAGWSMPMQYGSIVDEHQAVRTGVGMFDVSHMTRLRVSGPDADTLLDRALTRKVSSVRPGRLRYCVMCNESGGAIDDLLTFRPPATDPADNNVIHVVANAANRDAVVTQLDALSVGLEAAVADETPATAMIAVQGPRACDCVASLFDDSIAELKNYGGASSYHGGAKCSVTRTGYTGEDGFEIVAPIDAAARLWNELLNRGSAPCGLAARDLLRIEAAMPLYGQELSAEIDPLTAGLRFAVDLDRDDFIGRDALLRVSADENRPVRIGLTVSGKRAARAGSVVMRGGEPIGEVTSGVFSPTVGAPISMAYVQPGGAAGEQLTVDIRGARVEATIAPLPFFRRGG